MMASVPKIPMPRATLFPTAMISMQVTMLPSTIVWMKERE